jgi:ABC-type Fe3+-hydroxamate transport system substrate-binding protein
MMNMTEEQFERYMEAYENRTEAMQNIADNLDGVRVSIANSYDGTSTSAFYGISQAMFNISEDGLMIRKERDE